MIGWGFGLRRFLVGSISVFHLDALKGAEERSSGTGGFAFWGESSHPIVYDLNSAEGRDYFGLDDEDLADVSVVPMRVRIGEEASCLNLNKAQTPRLLGVVPIELSDREAFSFMKTMEGLGEGHPWSLLETSFSDGASLELLITPMMWAMRKKLGDTIEYTNSRGDVFNVLLVGAVANSILQGNVLISEKNFISAYPDAEGFQGFLVDCPPDRMEEVSDKLGRVLRNEGLELTSTVVRLNRFNAVQNTYLATFQVLGGLGVLLGVAGLGVVTIRNAMDRRGELGIMLALGFQKPRLFQWILMEHIALLVIGSLLGLLQQPWRRLGLILKAPAPRWPTFRWLLWPFFWPGFCGRPRRRERQKERLWRLSGVFSHRDCSVRTLLDLSRFLIPWIAIVALSAQGDGDWFRQDFEGSQVGAEFDPLENLILEGTFVISEEKAGKVLAVSQGSTGEFGFMFGPALTSGSLQVDYFAESGSRRLQPRFGIRACGMRGPALFYAPIQRS